MEIFKLSQGFSLNREMMLLYLKLYAVQVRAGEGVQSM